MTIDDKENCAAHAKKRRNAPEVCASVAVEPLGHVTQTRVLHTLNLHLLTNHERIVKIQYWPLTTSFPRYKSRCQRKTKHKMEFNEAKAHFGFVRAGGNQAG